MSLPLLFVPASFRTALLPRRTVRLAGVVLLDTMAVAGALWLSAAAADRTPIDLAAGSGRFVVSFVAVAVSAFFVAGLYRRSWRFLSLDDCLVLCVATAAGLLAAWLFSLAMFHPLRRLGLALVPFGIIHLSLTLMTMAAMRIARRLVRERWRAQHAVRPSGGRCRRILLLGDPDWARGMIELIRADVGAAVEVVGLLAIDGRDHRLQIAGVPVLGTPEMLSDIVTALAARGRRPNCIVLRQDDAMDARELTRIVSKADQLDLTVARARDPWGSDAGGRPRIGFEPLPLADLLGRPEIRVDREFVDRTILGRRVMVTGAGGTIGSELVRQLATFRPAEIVLLDHAEYNLYSIDLEMREAFPGVRFHPVLCSVRQRDALSDVFDQYRPELVFHAAALKHVPLVEANPAAGVHTNVIGTRNVADMVCEHGARAMIQVSTDKAVNPVGMMGASKRLGELYCQALDLVGACDPEAPRFMTVRFGNVLGSSGSLIPLFQRQLAKGRPLTVTHPDIERFFMTVEEAVQLILTSTARALEEQSEHGNLFVLDMGEPVKIVDIAKRVIRLAGLEPGVDAEIKFVGLRPGEKLFEELFDSEEDRLPSNIPGIFEARPNPVPLHELISGFDELERLIHSGEIESLRTHTHLLVTAPHRSRWSEVIRSMMANASAPATPAAPAAVLPMAS